MASHRALFSVEKVEDIENGDDTASIDREVEMADPFF
jgi:hypothetical protein